MRLFNRAVGQSLMFGEITVTIVELRDGEVLLRIDCPGDTVVEARNPDQAAMFSNIMSAVSVAQQRSDGE